MKTLPESYTHPEESEKENATLMTLLSTLPLDSLKTETRQVR